MRVGSVYTSSQTDCRSCRRGEKTVFIYLVRNRLTDSPSQKNQVPRHSQPVYGKLAYSRVNLLVSPVSKALGGITKKTPRVYSALCLICLSLPFRFIQKIPQLTHSAPRFPPQLVSPSGTAIRL